MGPTFSLQPLAGVRGLHPATAAVAVVAGKMAAVSLLTFATATSTLRPTSYRPRPRLPRAAPPVPSRPLRGRLLLGRAFSKDPKESLFLDEDGAVEDMDGYINQLSLEYDSVWDTKPAWCQPWTITLTGVVIVFSSWIVLHSILLTGIVLSLVCTWWYIFLYAYPKEYSNMIDESRKMVMSGLEDTFGGRKS